MSEPKWTLVLVTGPRPPRCPVTRGPRSTVRCEGTEEHDDPLHGGRGRFGQWFFWMDGAEK